MSNLQTAPAAAAAAPVEVDSKARKALWGAAIGYAMDGFDLLILGFMLRAISADLQLTPTQAGSLVTWTLIGAVARRHRLRHAQRPYYGRVRVLTWTILLFAVFTGLCAFAQGYWDLLIYRTIAGLGLGGEFGIGMALVAEAWPASKRARASSYVGARLAGRRARRRARDAAAAADDRLARHVRGRHPAGDRRLRRPPYRRRAARSSSRSAKNAAEGLGRCASWSRTAETTKLSLGMVILCSVQNFGYYGVMIWLPNYLSTRFGFALTQSAVWTAVTICGMAFGILAVRPSRRPGRARARSSSATRLGAAVMVVVYSQLTDPMQLLIGGAVMGFFVNGMLGGYGALIVGALSRPRRARPPRTCCSTSAAASAASGRSSSARIAVALRLPDRHRAARHPLHPRYRRDVAAHPRKARRGAAVGRSRALG